MTIQKTIATVTITLLCAACNSTHIMSDAEVLCEASGNVKSITYKANNRTRYDDKTFEFDKVHKYISNDSECVICTYDKKGRLISWKDNDDDEGQFSYDYIYNSENKLISINWYEEHTDVHYNRDGTPEYEISSTYEGGFTYTIKLYYSYKFDPHNNWISRGVTEYYIFNIEEGTANECAESFCFNGYKRKIATENRIITYWE